MPRGPHAAVAAYSSVRACAYKKCVPSWIHILPAFKSKYKSSRPDSNRRPTHYECVALPTALRKRKNALDIAQSISYDLTGNRTRVYAVRGRRLDRLTMRPKQWCIPAKVHRGDKIRTCGLCVPNAALYQTEPRLDTFHSIIQIVLIVNKIFAIFLIFPLYPKSNKDS